MSDPFKGRFLEAATYESRDGLVRRAVVFDRVQQSNQFLLVSEKGMHMDLWADDVTFVRFLKDAEEANAWLTRADGSTPDVWRTPEQAATRAKYAARNSGCLLAFVGLLRG